MVAGAEIEPQTEAGGLGVWLDTNKGGRMQDLSCRSERDQSSLLDHNVSQHNINLAHLRCSVERSANLRKKHEKRHNEAEIKRVSDLG